MRLPVFIIAALLTACASPTGGGERRYSGLYTEGMETMLFQAEGRDERWAVSSGYEGLQAAAPPRADPNDGFTICATVEGRLSPRGRYGHLGMFPHELAVTRVIEAGPCA